jgi:cobalt-zinc-cadmium efflux system membrane fusion protein
MAGADVAVAQPEEEPARKQGSLLQVVISALPAVAVFAVLGGVALWGHLSHWKFPVAAAVGGNSNDGNSDDWCDEHAVPNSICVECNPGKFPDVPHFDWDADYGIPDNVLAHPEIAQVYGEPRMPQYNQLAALGLRKRQANGEGCSYHLHRLQVASEEAAEKLGIEFEPVAVRPMTDEIEAVAEVIYDPTGVARLSSRAAGTVWRVRHELGDEVDEGEVLALIDSPQLARAKSDYIEAAISLRVKRQRYEALLEAGGAVPRRVMLDARSERDEAVVHFAETRQILANYGLPAPEWDDETEPDELIESMRLLGLPPRVAKEAKNLTDSSGLYPLVAPQKGVITQLDLVAGELIDTTHVLFVLADRDSMLLTMKLAPENARYAVRNTEVRFVDDLSQLRLHARVSWVSTVVDDTTRLLEVRAVIDDVTDEVRANIFGTAHIILREEPHAVVVPRESMQWEGCCNVVFVRDKEYRLPGKPKVMHIRTVRPLAQDDQFVEVVGVLPGEVVVSKGAETMRAQMLRNNLGAG